MKPAVFSRNERVSPSDLIGETVVIRVLEWIPEFITKATKTPVPAVRINVYRPSNETTYHNVYWTHKIIVSTLKAYENETVVLKFNAETNSSGQKYITVEPPSDTETRQAVTYWETVTVKGEE